MPRETPVVPGRTYPKDRSKLSQKPENIRARARRKNKDLTQEIDLYMDVVAKPLEDWDLEELAHGRPRDKGGMFRGRKPSWVTQAIQIEARKRLSQRALSGVLGEVDHAIKVVHDLMTSTEVDEGGNPLVSAKVKLDAAKFVIEQTLGKAKIRVDVEEGSALHTLLAGSLVNPDGGAAHPIVDGEVVYEEDDDAGDDDDA